MRALRYMAAAAAATVGMGLSAAPAGALVPLPDLTDLDLLGELDLAGSLDDATESVSDLTEDTVDIAGTDLSGLGSTDLVETSDVLDSSARGVDSPDDVDEAVGKVTDVAGGDVELPGPSTPPLEDAEDLFGGPLNDLLSGLLGEDGITL
jgi:hypothetical protein